MELNNNLDEQIEDVPYDNTSVKKCPRCGMEYTQFPALSRRDNKTYICPDCGVAEAFEDFFGKKTESEEVKTLYDLIKDTGYGIDCSDTAYDMLVYIDFDDESNDSFDRFVKKLCKSLHCVSYDDNSATVDLYKWVESNFNVLDSIFDTSAIDKEEEIEILVTEVLPSVVSGNATDYVYEELLNKCKFEDKLQETLLNEKQFNGKEIEQSGEYTLLKVAEEEYVIVCNGQEVKRFKARTEALAKHRLEVFAKTPSNKVPLNEAKYYQVMATNRGMWGGMTTPLRFDGKVILFSNRDTATKYIEDSNTSNVNNFNSYRIEETNISNSSIDNYLVINTMEDLEKAREDKLNRENEKQDRVNAKIDEIYNKLIENIPNNVKLEKDSIGIMVRIYKDGSEYAYSSKRLNISEKDGEFIFRFDDMTISEDNIEDFVNKYISNINKRIGKKTESVDLVTYKKDNEYDVKYLTLTGEEKCVKIKPEQDMNIPKMINKLKEEDKDFLKLVEDVNNLHGAKEYSKEVYKLVIALSKKPVSELVNNEEYDAYVMDVFTNKNDLIDGKEIGYQFGPFIKNAKTFDIDDKYEANEIAGKIKESDTSWKSVVVTMIDTRTNELVKESKELKTESRNDVETRVNKIKEYKQKINDTVEEDDLESISNEILSYVEDIKDINYAAEDLYNGFLTVMDDGDAEAQGPKVYIKSVKLNMNNILDDFINNYEEACEDELLEESKDIEDTFEFTYTSDEIVENLLDKTGWTYEDMGYDSWDEYVEDIKNNVDGIKEIQSEEELSTITGMGPSFPGFKNGKVKTILEDGRVFISDNENGEVSLIDAVQLIDFKEVK